MGRCRRFLEKSLVAVSSGGTLSTTPTSMEQMHLAHLILRLTSQV